MKFVAAPLVRFGDATQQKPGRDFARGLWARAFMPAVIAEPDSSIEPLVVVERYFPAVRVRAWRAAIGGRLWTSPGYLSISLLGFGLMWLRALRRDPLPRARAIKS